VKNGITRRDALKLSGLTLGTLAVGSATGGCKNQPLDPMKRNDLIESLPPYYPGRETLAADEMRITFLGTSCIPRLAQECNSVFVEVGGGENGEALDQFVFDCGTGVVAKYNAMGIPMRKMNKIFLTHLHGDHMSDLTHIYCFGPAQDRKSPLYIWGPGPSGLKDPIDGYTYNDDGLNVFCQKFRDIMRWHTESFSFGATRFSSNNDPDNMPTKASWGLPMEPTAVVPTTGPKDPINSAQQPMDGYSLVPFQMDWTKKGEVAGDNIAYNNPTTGVKITHFPAIHTRKGSISYKLEWKGLSMIFSGDTKPNKEMIAQASGVTVLVHEMVVPAEIWAAKNFGLRKPPADQTDPTWQKALNYATAVQNSSHTPQGAFGYLLSQMDPPPKLAVATHFQATDDTIESAFKSIRDHYPEGDVTIAADLMVISVTPDRITKRKAVVEDYAWYPVGRVDATDIPKYHDATGNPAPEAQIDPTQEINPGPDTYDSSGY